MNDKELHKELVRLTGDRDRWEENIPYVSSLLARESPMIRAKALWLLGEMGLKYPQAVVDALIPIAAFCESPLPLLRARAINALGRIGRGDFRLIEPYWASLFRFASDADAGVRLSFVWASENIAVNTPDIYEEYMPIYASLLSDADDKVRMETPEFFRVIGKRRPRFARPFAALLQTTAQTDENPVVRIHCLGAIKAMGTE